MVYKIVNNKDLQSLPVIPESARKVLQHYVSILNEEYGENRNPDYEGGYVLYATPHSTADEIKAVFDFTQNIVEFVSVTDDICSAVYIVSADFGVVIVMHVSDKPKEIKDMIGETTL